VRGRPDAGACVVAYARAAPAAVRPAAGGDGAAVSAVAERAVPYDVFAGVGYFIVFVTSKASAEQMGRWQQ